MVKSYKQKQNNRKGRKYSKKRKKGGANEVEGFYDSVKKIITKIKIIKCEKNVDLMDRIKSKYNISKPIAEGKNGKIFAHKSEDKILKIVTLNTFNFLKPINLPDVTVTVKKSKENNCQIKIGESFGKLIKKVDKRKEKILSIENKGEKVIKGKTIEVYSTRKLIPKKAIDYNSQLKIRHSPITYDNYTEYFDMLCCLFDLRKAYYKIEKYQDCNKSQDGGSSDDNDNDDNDDVINYKPAVNEIVIQKILQGYLEKMYLPKWIIDFDDYYITKSEIGIEQEKIGKQMDNFYISNLAEYIEYFLIKNKDSKLDKDVLFKHILTNMLGINIRNIDLDSFFKQLNAETKEFIETYLKTDKLLKDSFFKILRTLYEQLKFLHLDFKMKNIFVRYTNYSNKFEYDNFECVIGDLDKSRLKIDFSNLKFPHSDFSKYNI